MAISYQYDANKNLVLEKVKGVINSHDLRTYVRGVIRDDNSVYIHSHRIMNKYDILRG